MKAALLTALLLIASSAHADATISPLVVLAHTSDFTESARHEVTQDFVGFGAEARFKTVTIKGALGRKATNCSFSHRCGSSYGGYAALEWTPRFGRRPPK